MRIVFAVTAAATLAASIFAAAPVQAQGGSFMWCQAMASNGSDSDAYYSAFFAAGAWQAEAKAKEFKGAVEDEIISAASVTAKCTLGADYDAAVAGRNAAMKAAPGTILAWEG
ncbi:MAG: hypothetical protein B7Z38_05815 [Rhodobacterales bacterium 12-64-8]|nr:MAG: hypothetical protein B7Z38_05815 [Rhodobacterales bacterium 12-64-8]OYX50197.1 MAG: hypothetical protein B7Y90_04235 [Alphaproteobacteria bacterium 32-64-14]